MLLLRRGSHLRHRSTTACRSASSSAASTQSQRLVGQHRRRLRRLRRHPAPITSTLTSTTASPACVMASTHIPTPSSAMFSSAPSTETESKVDIPSVEGTKQLLRDAACVCFDVDSTVSTEEGIDVLAEALGKGEEVAAWTRKAMGGSVLFQDAIAARLDILQPTQAQLDALIEKHDFPLTPGMPELVNKLRARGTKVVLVSGGLFQLVWPVAQQLDIPEEDVYAIRLFFHDEVDGDGGRFKGFDRDAFTASTGGKQRVMQQVKDSRGLDPIVMVGDGVTDLEAFPVAQAVIGFGGNVVREKVKEDAHWFVHSVDELLAALE